MNDIELETLENRLQALESHVKDTFYDLGITADFIAMTTEILNDLLSLAAKSTKVTQSDLVLFSRRVASMLAYIKKVS